MQQQPSSGNSRLSSARRASFSAEYHRVVTVGPLSPPPANPQPQFISASAAAQIVTADQDVNSTAIAPGTSEVIVSAASLALLNGFLDHLLFNILLAAKSTKLVAVRPAISEVLKPRLAKEVVAAADEELSEYMVGGDEDELSDFGGTQEPHGALFELERSWKLTRLRCMVYTRLGDMEEDDEEEYLHQEGLDEQSGGPGRFSNVIGHVTPAAAIFLTSILEYIGEHALIVAGDVARARMNSRRSPDGHRRDTSADSNQFIDKLVIEDMDMEKLALNATLGRLWRTWRKQVRKGPMLSRTPSRESLIRKSRRLSAKTSSRQSSIATVATSGEPMYLDGSQADRVDDIDEEFDPAAVPLPVSSHDVDEIEVPGFRAALAIAIPYRSYRPRSLILSSPDSATSSPSLRVSRLNGLGSPTHGRSWSLPGSAIRATADDAGSDTSNLTLTQDKLQTMPEEQGYGRDASSPEDSRYSEDSAGKFMGMKDQTEDLSPPGRRHGVSSGKLPEGTHERDWSPDGSQLSNLSSNRHAHVIHGQVMQGPHPPRVPERSYFRQVNPNDSRDPGPLTTAIAAPIPRDPTGKLDIEKLAQDSIVQTSFVSRPPKPVSQPPRLTPLREMVQGAKGSPEDESADANSTSSVTERESASWESARSQSSRTKIWAGNSRSAGSDNTTTPRFSPNTPILTPGSERAAVQRVGPPPPNSATYKSRRSESISSHTDSKRPNSGSAVSTKLKGLVGLHTGDPTIPLSTSRRTSSDTNGRVSGAGDGSEEATDLDQLIMSDETIHYTLTPRNMREMETLQQDQSSPRWASAREESSDAVDKEDQVVQRNQSNEPRLTATSDGGVNGLRIRHAELAAQVAQKSSTTLTARSTGKAPMTIKPAAGVARDARVEAESIREFAEFIRNTGPAPVAPVPPERNSSASAVTSANSQLPPRSPFGSNDATTSSTTGTSRPATRRLEARAAVTEKDDTSDLIDFIRQGPPVDGGHRIARTVAPFRTTMDSEDFQALSPAKSEREAEMPSASSSAQDGSGITKSIDSSFNSRSPLLEPATGRTVHIHADPGPSQLSQSSSAFPPRKQRRVRDPYAIDSDDDDETIGEVSRTKPQREEESLMDFLRNVTPPPANDQVPQPLSVNVRRPNAAESTKSAAKLTASAVKSRFMRISSTDHGPVTKISRSSLRSPKQKVTSSSNPTPSVAPMLPMPSTYSQGLFGSTSQANVIESPTRESDASSPVDGKRNGLMPRDAVTESVTAELADFFRNTAPPPSPIAPSVTSTIEEERAAGTSGSLAKMFMRKRKQAVV